MKQASLQDEEAGTVALLKKKKKKEMFKTNFVFQHQQNDCLNLKATDMFFQRGKKCI